MAIKLIEATYCPCVDDRKRTYVLDSAADVADLPKCCVGSTAIVAAKDGPIYMVNASGNWEEL